MSGRLTANASARQSGFAVELSRLRCLMTRRRMSCDLIVAATGAEK